MSDEVQLLVALPLDGDGFLRRECPTCEREFKWLPSPDTEGDEAVIAGNEEGEASESYYYPYCAVTAPPNAWLTKAQVAAMEDVVRREVVDPELDKLERGIRKLNRCSGGLIGIEVRMDRDEPEPAQTLRSPTTCAASTSPAIRPNRSRCSTSGTGQ